MSVVAEPTLKDGYADVMASGNRILSRGLPDLNAPTSVPSSSSSSSSSVAAQEAFSSKKDTSSKTPHRHFEVSSEPAYPDEDGIVYTQTTTLSYSTAPVLVERTVLADHELPEPLLSDPTRMHATWTKRSPDKIEIETVYRGSGKAIGSEIENGVASSADAHSSAALLQQRIQSQDLGLSDGRRRAETRQYLQGRMEGNGGRRATDQPSSSDAKAILRDGILPTPAPPLCAGPSDVRIATKSSTSAKLASLVDEMRLDSLSVSPEMATR